VNPPARLSLFVQTIYSQLLDDLRDASAANPVGDRPGSFVAKTVSGKRYWYLQLTRDGTQIQKYLGPDSSELRDLIERLRASTRLRKNLSSMAGAGGAYVAPGAHRAVLALLADSGLFHAGGVLVGAHAFGVYGNMLGARWDRDLTHTQDIDVAHDPALAVAVARDLAIDLPTKLEQWAAMTFLPVPPSPLNPTHPVTSFRVRGTELKLELLTPLRGRERDRPIALPQLNAAAQPLRFLDYLIDDPVQAAVVGGDGVLVNVPQPARFALHKLLIAGRRSNIDKRRKDLAHAASLCWVLLDDEPADLADAWVALAARGKKWAKGVRDSLVKLDGALATRLQQVFDR
jgi:hypothetical protein